MNRFTAIEKLDLVTASDGDGLTGFRHLARRNRIVVVFIHGLGGSAFGKKRTWVNLPEYLWEDEAQTDVAFHSYRTLFRRLIFWRSVSLGDEAETFAHQLSLLPYDHIILVGHSLGGILARLALKQLVDSKDKNTLSKVVSLILMASPTLGARFRSAALGWLTHDFRALDREGDVIQSVEKLYNGDLSAQFNHKLHMPQCVPLWAITAAADRWVHKLSARAQVPHSQRRSVIGSHTEVVKPASKEEASYGHFLKMVREVIALCEPAIMHRLTVKGFEIRPATRADSANVFDCARRAFPGQELSSAETMESWLTWDPWCIWVLKKLGKAAGGGIQGYWCAFSLTELALKVVKSGKLTGPQLRYEHFSEGSADQAGIYVGAVVGNNQVAKGLVMKFAQKELERRTGGQIVEIIARAVTTDGLDLVNTLGFSGIDGEKIGSLFSGTSSARVKGRRRRNQRR